MDPDPSSHGSLAVAGSVPRWRAEVEHLVSEQLEQQAAERAERAEWLAQLATLQEQFGQAQMLMQVGGGAGPA